MLTCSVMMGSTSARARWARPLLSPCSGSTTEMTPDCSSMLNFCS